VEGDPQVEGLLHLAVLAIAISGGYIGLDKLGHEKFQAAFENIAPGAARELENTKKILKDLDLIEGEVAILHPRHGWFYQYVVCFVTGIRYELPAAYSFAFFFRRQMHVPLLGYFRRRWDVPTASAMLALSMVSCWYLVAASLRCVAPVQHQVLLGLFGFYILVIIWIFVLVLALQWKLQK
jgi:hypothetical protein